MAETSTSDPQTRLRFGEAWNGQGVIAGTAPDPILATELGILFEGDCLDVLPHVRERGWRVFLGGVDADFPRYVP